METIYDKDQMFGFLLIKFPTIPEEDLEKDFDSYAESCGFYPIKNGRFYSTQAEGEISHDGGIECEENLTF
jgi:hypothetical protein